MRVKRGVVEILVLLLLSPVYLLSKLIPKDKYLHIFGSSLGYHFADNSKYLFLYASKHVGHINSVFISKNRDVVKAIKSSGLNSEYLYSISGLRTVLRANKAFISHSTEDIHPIPLGGAEVIQLWHGTPLKKIGYDADWTSINGNMTLKQFTRKLLYSMFPYLYSSHNFDKIAISSNYVQPSFMSAFNIAEAKMDVIGQPRNDSMTIDYRFDEKYFPEIIALERLKVEYDYVISWLPTHRKPAPINILNLMDDYNFNIDDHNEKLCRLNAVLLLKPHFLELELVEDAIRDKSHIRVYRHVDPYPLLAFTDILITDYSSIFFDFLIMNKPIIFAPFDIDDYIRHNVGLYYDYDEVTPGPKCKDWTEVLKEIEMIIRFVSRGEHDLFSRDRARIKDLFNKYSNDFAKRTVDNYFEKVSLLK